jgi:hypothetical protein
MHELVWKQIKMSFLPYGPQNVRRWHIWRCKDVSSVDQCPQQVAVRKSLENTIALSEALKKNTVVKHGSRGSMGIRGLVASGWGFFKCLKCPMVVTCCNHPEWGYLKYNQQYLRISMAGPTWNDVWFFGGHDDPPSLKSRSTSLGDQ